MGIVVTPGYADFFEDKPTFDELILDIPTRLILIYCSLINAELYNNYFNLKKQADIFLFLTRRFPSDLRKRMANKLKVFTKDKNALIVIFVRGYTIEFIHRALLQPNESDLEDTTPEQEIRILKAYLLINDELNKRVEDRIFKGLNRNSPRMMHRTFIWPLLVHQTELNHDLSSHFQSLKLIAFLRYLTEHPLYSKYLTAYLAHIQESSALTYIYNILSFLQSGFKKQKDDSFIHHFSFIKPEKLSTLLQSLALDINSYSIHPELHVNYKGLKEKPLFEYRPNLFAAFSYGLFYNKLFNGFVFDFYHHSGLKAEPGYASFGNFKSKYGKEFSEVQLFRTMIKEIFQHKHTIIAFSDKDGMPDCYVRMGNCIFLIEFKDNFFPDKVVIEADYELIKKDIDQKLITNQDGKPKGIRQLLNQISFLENGCFEFDDFISHGIKKRNISIYPLIIHTNHIYTITDVNDYLNDEFRQNIRPVSFKVKDLILIDLETLFIFLQHFQKSKHAFRNSLDKYYSIKRNRIRKFNAYPDTHNFTQAYCSYENVCDKLGLQQHSLRSPGFMKEMFDALEIKLKDQ